MVCPWPDALLCDNVQPLQSVVEHRAENTPQQYSAHLASSAAFGVMHHIYRDVNSHFSSTRISDPADGPRCYHTPTSLVRHEEVNRILSISVAIIADHSAYTDVGY